MSKSSTFMKSIAGVLLTGILVVVLWVIGSRMPGGDLDALSNQRRMPGGGLDQIKRELVAEAGGFRKDQVVEGELMRPVGEERGQSLATRRGKFFVIVPADGREQFAGAKCEQQKAFYVNADDSGRSGTRAAYKVLQITFALCTDGPFSPAQVEETAEATQIRMKKVTQYFSPPPQFQWLTELRTSKLDDAGEIVQFTVGVFGEGIALFPTAVMTGPDKVSLVVQVYLSEKLSMLDLPKDAKLDTEVTAPLREALENPFSLTEALVRSAHAALN